MYIKLYLYYLSYINDKYTQIKCIDNKQSGLLNNIHQLNNSMFSDSDCEQYYV